MDRLLNVRARSVSREELYGIVWKTPMSRLGVEFGITGNGLAKICDRLKVPYPPRGYWAKKEAGKPVVTFRLQPRPDGVPGSVEIHPTQLKPKPSPQVRASAEAAAAATNKIAAPAAFGDLHPKVKEWLFQHNTEQKQREQENKRLKREPWRWAKPLREELTTRDLYRFKMTSRIFCSVEAAGGKIEKALMSGKAIFLVSGHKIECSIVEKMVKPVKRPLGDAAKWTAYPEFHQSTLQSSGYLRVTITTYLMGRQPQWIETPKHKIVDLLPEIVGGIISAGPMLDEQQRLHEERSRHYREEEALRHERQRLKEIDERHWARFRERAGDWETRARLMAFLSEIEERLQTECDTRVGDRQLSEWLAWVLEKIESLDPLSQGLRGLFESIVR